MRDEALTGEALLSSFCLLFLPLAQFPAMFDDHRRLLEITICFPRRTVDKIATCNTSKSISPVVRPCAMLSSAWRMVSLFRSRWLPESLVRLPRHTSS